MITLTYRRDGYESPLALFRAAREERHVREFMRKLGEYLGASLRGLWMRKMEFHERGGGWVHWHVLLDWRSRIPHSALMELWGHGGVNVQKATRTRVRYVAKYCAKFLDQVPAWVLAEPASSLKVVAVSPGFWPKEPVPDDNEGWSSLPEDERVSVAAKRGAVIHDRLMKLPIYATVGQMLQRQRECVEIVRWSFMGGEYWREWHRFRLPLWKVVEVLAIHDMRLGLKEGHDWIVCVPSGDAVDALLSDLGLVEAEVWVAAASGQPAAAAALYLSQESNPQSAWMEPWLIEYLMRLEDETIEELRMAA